MTLTLQLLKGWVTRRVPITKEAMLPMVRNAPMKFANGVTEYSFSRMWDRFANDHAAEVARDVAYRDTLAHGKQASRHVLDHQCRPYSGLDSPDDRCCKVYKLRAWKEAPHG